MSIGTPFHPRTAPLAESYAWKEWAGYHAACRYQPCHDQEYSAIRQTCGLIDVSPLYKYRISGPQALFFVDRLVPRNMEKVRPGRVVYVPWCDENGKTIDDGTIQRLGDENYRITSANPSLSWFRLVGEGLDVQIQDESESVASLALQGPSSLSILESLCSPSIEQLKFFGVQDVRMGSHEVTISRTGFTGDLGYELWVSSQEALSLWDLLLDAGSPLGLLPVGLDALDITRIEAGLILIDVDFRSVRHAWTDSQAYTPFELSLDWSVHLKHPGFIGHAALELEAKSGPPRRVVGLICSWEDLESIYESFDLPVQIDSQACRTAVPIYSGGLQVGKATSSTWSPVLKQMLAIATLDAQYARTGTELEMEWTVEAVRRTIRAWVVQRPFFDPPRKRD